MQYAQLAFMPAHVLRNFLFDIAQGCAPGEYRIPCGTNAQAMKLRNRFNKVRATDRAQARKDYAAMNETLDRNRGESPMDWLVFRVDGADAVVVKSPTTKADLYNLAGIGHMLSSDDRTEDALEKRRSSAALPELRENDGRPASGTGAYDTAPKPGEDVF